MADPPGNAVTKPPTDVAIQEKWKKMAKELERKAKARAYRLDRKERQYTSMKTTVLEWHQLWKPWIDDRVPDRRMWVRVETFAESLSSPRVKRPVRPDSVEYRFWRLDPAAISAGSGVANDLQRADVSLRNWNYGVYVHGAHHYTSDRFEPPPFAMRMPGHLTINHQLFHRDCETSDKCRQWHSREWINLKDDIDAKHSFNQTFTNQWIERGKNALDLDSQFRKDSIPYILWMQQQRRQALDAWYKMSEPTRQVYIDAHIHLSPASMDRVKVRYTVMPRTTVRYYHLYALLRSCSFLLDSLWTTLVFDYVGVPLIDTGQPALDSVKNDECWSPPPATVAQRIKHKESVITSKTVLCSLPLTVDESTAQPSAVPVTQPSPTSSCTGRWTNDGELLVGIIGSSSVSGPTVRCDSRCLASGYQQAVSLPYPTETHSLTLPRHWFQPDNDYLITLAIGGTELTTNVTRAAALSSCSSSRLPASYSSSSSSTNTRMKNVKAWRKCPWTIFCLASSPFRYAWLCLLSSSTV